MEDILNKITEVIYAWLLQRQYHIPKEAIKVVLSLVFVSGIFPIIYKTIKKIFSEITTFRAKKDLHPIIDRKDVNSATRYYIQTKGQNISPSNENEPRYSQAFTTKQKLIPFYLSAIKDYDNPTQYYLILADSGMGKTTFLINFYLSYKRLLFKRKYDIIILPLAHPEIDELIKNTKNKKSTILLLDGFDEDPKAAVNYNERITVITKNTWEFRKVLITTRTQFFPSENLEPYETKLFRFSLNDETQHYFKKIYLSPFDNKDVSRYLNKKFPAWKFWDFRKRANANKIIGLCPNLMVRPMLLSYIDDLVDKKGSEDIFRTERKKIFLNSADIYKVLIARWIERESNRIDTSMRKLFISNMYLFSEELALFLFKNRQHNLSISSEEIMPFAKNHNIDLSELELKGKSLLNRDANGNYKFAHKSIFEYFLAKMAMDNNDFGEGTLFFAKMQSFDQAAKFCEEMLLDKPYISE